jgi:large subunit ribosomal protein L25
MSESTSILAESRENNISAKILRKSGEIPAIVYGQENTPKLIKILEKDLVKILENPSIFSQVIELNQNDDAVKVILKEVQVNPSNDRPIHVDFQAVSEKTNITINVPLKFINEEICIGVKQQGGMISHLKNEIELTCNAQNLPEFIEIDMKDIEIGSNIMQSQIILPEGVSLSINILNNQDQPVASVNVTRAALDIDDELSEEGDQGESEESSDEASETSDAADESNSKEESKD